MRGEPSQKPTNPSASSAPESPQRDVDAIVDEAAIESFPASDPPSWTASHPGPSSPPARTVESAAARALVEHLHDDLDGLVGRLREHDRSAAEIAGKARAATDYIARRFLRSGRALTRYPVPGSASAQNLEVELRGESTPEEVVVVGAHFGAARCLAHGYDDATGAAALLALARAFAGRRFARTVRLVAFADEAEGIAFTPTLGSLHYADYLRRAGTRVAAVMCMDAIGYSRSDRHPAYSTLLKPYSLRRGDYVALVANLRSRLLVHRAARAFASTVKDVHIQSVVVPGLSRPVRWSDLYPFYRRGFSAFLLTDAELLGATGDERPRPTPVDIDFDRLALLVPGIAAIVADLASQDFKRTPR